MTTPGLSGLRFRSGSGKQSNVSINRLLTGNTCFFPAHVIYYILMGVHLQVKDFHEPQILEAGKDFLIVFKPSKMHSAPLAKSSDTTILDWCAREYPEVVDFDSEDEFVNDNSQIETQAETLTETQAEIPDKYAEEGGLLHRLDYETHGLLLVARTLHGMETLIEQQKQRRIIKEYNALTGNNKSITEGFPNDKPNLPSWIFRDKHRIGDSIYIKSAFRPYGPGRKVVRPVLPDIQQQNYLKSLKQGKEIALDGYRPYLTDVITGRYLSVANEITETQMPVLSFFRLRILRGFRHQIRCHLAWAGWPILNDTLYNGFSYGKGFLGLRACLLSFTDPSSGKELSFSIPPLELEDI